MLLTSKIVWQQANFHYLCRAVDRIRQTLITQVGLSDQTVSETQPLGSGNPELPEFEPHAPPAIERLAALFDLSPFEQDILLLCVAMEIDPQFELLCASAQGNPHRNYPTLSLALKALPGADWSVCSSLSPLHRWQLISFGNGQSLTQSPLRIDRRILCYLLGQPSSDLLLERVVKPFAYEPAHAVLRVKTYQSLVDQLTQEWLDARKGNALPLLRIYGTNRETRQQIAAAVCHRLGLNLYTVLVSLLPVDSEELYKLLHRWQREAYLTNSALLLETELDGMDSQRTGLLSMLVEHLESPLILSSADQQAPFQRPLIAVEVPPLTHEEQRQLWETYLFNAEQISPEQINILVSQFNLSPTVVQSVCLSVPGHSSESVPTQLWNKCRSLARPQLSDLAQRLEVKASWQDLVLPELQLQVLQQLVSQAKYRAQVYHEWGFAQRSDRGLGISALFAGPSGTGKTLTAEVMAHEVGLDLYRIDLSTVVSKYIGETEKNLRRIFDAAETSGAVLLFDEADALFGKRTEVKDSHDRHANIEVSYLLQRMESYSGLAILTTNLKSSLDQAFLRRIRFVVSFPFPDLAARAEIWRRVFPAATPTQGLDVQKLARLNIAGGNIRNVAINAAFLAASLGEPVTMRHLLQAARSEYVKLERTLTDSEIKGWVLPEVKNP